jgi:hypothetical protein
MWRRLITAPTLSKALLFWSLSQIQAKPLVRKFRQASITVHRIEEFVHFGAQTVGWKAG